MYFTATYMCWDIFFILRSEKILHCCLYSGHSTFSITSEPDPDLPKTGQHPSEIKYLEPADPVTQKVSG